ncbi:MAG: hypothetical protein SGJ09_12335 [Phycisphaerae bacterium]|nr:hypothetical protein [Phycisphaerae bacterium]
MHTRPSRDQQFDRSGGPIFSADHLAAAALRQVARRRLISPHNEQRQRTDARARCDRVSVRIAAMNGLLSP